MRQAFSELFPVLLAQCFPGQPPLPLQVPCPSLQSPHWPSFPQAPTAPHPGGGPKSSDSFLLHLLVLIQACPPVLGCPRSACCPSHPVSHLGMAAATAGAVITLPSSFHRAAGRSFQMQMSLHPMLGFPQPPGRSVETVSCTQILHCPPHHPRGSSQPCSCSHRTAPHAPHTLSLSPLLPPFTCRFPSGRPPRSQAALPLRLTGQQMLLSSLPQDRAQLLTWWGCPGAAGTTHH